MPGPQTHLVAVRDGSEIVRVNTLQREGDNARAPRRRRSVQRQAFDVAQRLVRVLGDLPLVRAYGLHAEPGEIVDRGPQADDLAYGLRAGLELPRQVVVGRAFDAHGLDHVAARLERVHGLQQLAAAVKNARAGRAEHLVAAESVEVAAERPHVDALVRSALGAVHEHCRAGGLGGGDHLPRGVDGAQSVRHLAEGDQLGGAFEQLVELVETELAALVDVDVLDVRAVGRGEDLPRDDVGVVVEDREHDEVAGLHVLAAPGVSHQVDGLGGASRVDDLLRRGSVDERAYLLASALVALGRHLSYVVRSAMDVRVEVLEVVEHRSGHLAWALRGVR